MILLSILEVHMPMPYDTLENAERCTMRILKAKLKRLLHISFTAFSGPFLFQKQGGPMTG